MDHMSDDEEFDRWVAEAAADYHRPPAEVPRKEMWDAIRGGLAEPRARVAPPVAASPVLRLVRRFTVRRVFPLLAAAAVLVAVAYRVGRSTGEREALQPVVASTDDSPAYEVATRAHFDRAELLLASTHESLGRADLDPALGQWARDMLSETRLLLDSPAGTPAARRALLEDLELTFAQIVRLSAASTPDDKALMDRSLRGGDLLSRLRTSVPATARGT
jgi:hypothetical protein